MAFPAFDLYPSETLFPGSPQPINNGGGYFSLAEIALNNLILTADDSAGVEWIVETLDGWMGSPSSSLKLTPRSRAAGSWAGPRTLNSRVLAVKGKVFAPSAASLAAAVDRLNVAASLDASLFTLSEDGLSRSCIVYRQDEVLISRMTAESAAWSLQLSAPDPRKFTAAVSASTRLPSGSGGLTVPLTVPFTVNSTTLTGEIDLTNRGNATGPVTLRIDGPVVGPQITHVGSGAQLVFSSSLSLAAGEWLEVDTEAQTALANGQASRNGYITQRGWFGFEPGANKFAFTAVSGSGLLTVTAAPSWQ